MQKWLNTYFEFSKREFNGLLSLIMLILMVSAIPSVYRLMVPGPEENPVEQLVLKKLMLPEKQTVNLRAKGPKSTIEKHKPRHPLFYFDPNVININDWQKLGLSAKQSAAIVKYIAKGGRFKKTEDLQKMYTISNNMYKRLAPYVQIALQKNSSAVNLKKDYPSRRLYTKPGLVTIEINGADSIALIQIKGIGASFANRIIKYRNRLGGFYKKEQLMEVFGLDTIKYKEIKDQITIDTGSLKKININTADFNDFKTHPYIRYKQVNAIIQYRKQHGKYSNIADLYKVAVLSIEAIANLAPYLTF